MPDDILSEDDLENSPQPLPKSGVAVHKKHAYKTVVIKPSQSDPLPSKVISQDAVAVGKVIPQSPSLETKTSRDRINNLTQKEGSMEKVGLTRKLPYQRIVEALNATKMVEYRDSAGNVLYKEEPDFEKNKWGTEMALKAFGDLIERKEVTHEAGDETLARYKALSVTDLKAMALDLLAGKAVSRLPVLDVEPEASP